MKSITSDQIINVSGKRITGNEKFHFQCYEKLACFNKCCRNLNLFLYPYDIIRLKQNLNISSDVFLDTYVDIILRPDNFFPDILLKMTETDEKTCPFLTEKGCSVYIDRPDTCRTFPIEKGMLFNDNINNHTVISLFKPPAFCLGRHEQKSLTLNKWAEDQKAFTHNKMTEKWSLIKYLFYNDPWGSEGAYGPKGKMAFMAAYNIDKFRNFIFKSTFLKKYKVKTSMLKKAGKDDTVLLGIGFSWIKFFIFNIKSKNITIR